MGSAASDGALIFAVGLACVGLSSLQGGAAVHSLLNGVLHTRPEIKLHCSFVHFLYPGVRPVEFLHDALDGVGWYNYSCAI